MSSLKLILSCNLLFILVYKKLFWDGSVSRVLERIVFSSIKMIMETLVGHIRLNIIIPRTLWQSLVIYNARDGNMLIKRSRLTLDHNDPKLCTEVEVKYGCALENLDPCWNAFQVSMLNFAQPSSHLHACLKCILYNLVQYNCLCFSAVNQVLIG